MNLAAGEQHRADVGRDRARHADHGADGRHLSHAGGARGRLEVLHPGQRRHRARAVRHHPRLSRGARGGRRGPGRDGLERADRPRPRRSIPGCSTSPSCSCCSATAPRSVSRHCTLGCPMPTPRARRRSPRCSPGSCSTSRCSRSCASSCCSPPTRALAPGPLMITMGLVSAVFASFMLYRRRDIKRMFAYSSIEHMGIITFAFGMGGPLANFAGLLHMTMHSLTKSAIFFGVGHVAQVKGTQRIADIRGLTESHPVLGWGLVLGVVAIAGMPPLGIFMSEFLVVSSPSPGQPLLAVPLVAGLIIGFGALMLRLHGLAFGAPRAAAPRSRPPMRRCSPIWRWSCSPASICRRRWSPGSRTSPRGWAEACRTMPAVRSPRPRRSDRGAQPLAQAPRDRRAGAAVERSGLWRGDLTLLGLFGEPQMVHMALLDEASGEIAVLSLACRRPISLGRRDIRRRSGSSARSTTCSAWRPRRARRAPLARSRRLGRPEPARRAAAPASRADPLCCSCRSKARACIRSRSGRCTPASSSPATSASPPAARPWCAWRSASAMCTKGSRR